MLLHPNISYSHWAHTICIQDRTRDEDPREAILKFAEKAESDPYWIAPAYKECVRAVT